MLAIVLSLAAGLWHSAAAHGQPPAPADAPFNGSQRVMADLSPERVHELMNDFNRALGVDCAHCHVPDRWADETKSAFGVARNKFRMVQVINEQLEEVGEIGCWTCNGGQLRPSHLPRPTLDAELARRPADLASAPEGQKLTMTVYNVSLGVACDHCHSSDWKKADKSPLKMVKLMSAMFAEFPKYMPPTARTQCFMCHKGSIRPQARRPR
jgi:hypothetical protein